MGDEANDASVSHSILVILGLVCWNVIGQGKTIGLGSGGDTLLGLVNLSDRDKPPWIKRMIET